MSHSNDVIMPEPFREIPVSGMYEEHDFGEGSERRWIKFTDSQYGEWCGKFEPGDKPGHEKILWFPDSCDFFILADGRGYIVNADSRKLLARTQSDMLEDAVVVPTRDMVAVTNGLTVALFGRTGDIWESERISLDGIGFDRVCDDRVIGKLNDLTDDWRDFSFHVVERRVEATWTYADAFKPTSVSQLKLARIVVATFGAFVTGFGLTFYARFREEGPLVLIVLGIFCMLVAIFSSRSRRRKR